MTRPRSSVAIPNVNGEGFLPDCLTALRDQTDTYFEVILVDNGSTDRSLTLVGDSFRRYA
jgi:glycosyltransferase involved in cell wall biosynthesis